MRRVEYTDLESRSRVSTPHAHLLGDDQSGPSPRMPHAARHHRAHTKKQATGCQRRPLGAPYAPGAGRAPLHVTSTTRRRPRSPVLQTTHMHPHAPHAPCGATGQLADSAARAVNTSPPADPRSGQAPCPSTAVFLHRLRHLRGRRGVGDYPALQRRRGLPFSDAARVRDRLSCDDDGPPHLHSACAGRRGAAGQRARMCVWAHAVRARAVGRLGGWAVGRWGGWAVGRLGAAAPARRGPGAGCGSGLAGATADCRNTNAQPRLRSVYSLSFFQRTHTSDACQHTEASTHRTQ